jgi:hypothetical protein
MEDAATEALLARDPRPTAIIAGGNQLLIGCLARYGDTTCGRGATSRWSHATTCR